MAKIRGTNLGNWLVLEKWMKPDLFEGTGAEDEIWLNRKLSGKPLEDLMKNHRDSYVTAEDFAKIKSWGLNMVRIPVPYFVFGDVPPFLGCIEYLDMAFDWAEKYGLQILIDLHTVPGSQNGYDNGGLTGVCKWHKDPEGVEFALTVLERLAERYAGRKGLFGIEVLNEPISLPVYLTAPSTGKAEDKEEAKGSGYVPMKFLKTFYLEAYRRIRKYLPEDKAVVFHDGFRFTAWNRFFDENDLKNVFLDTHIYIFAMEGFSPIHNPWLYRTYVNINCRMIAGVQRHVPVIVGEWCVCNKYAYGMKQGSLSDAEFQKQQASRFHEVAEIELEAWNTAEGWFYWNYQLLRDREAPMDSAWKESWDLSRCTEKGWITFN